MPIQKPEKKEDKRSKQRPSKEWQTIGFAGVDSGILLIADPCYFIGRDCEAQNKYGGDWGAALSDMYAKGGKNFEVANLDYVRGHAGLGTVVHMDGDGSYPIEARFDVNGRVKEIRIRIRP